MYDCDLFYLRVLIAVVNKLWNSSWNGQTEAAAGGSSQTTNKKVLSSISRFKISRRKRRNAEQMSGKANLKLVI